MKKLFFLSLAVFMFSFSAKAQHQGINFQTDKADISVISPPEDNRAQAKTASTTINDTLDYFFLKHYFKNPNIPASNPPNLSFATLKSPYPSSLLNIGMCGAIFRNSANINVHGLQGLVIKQSNSFSTNVPIKLYLCNVNASNLPILPPLDSVSATVSNAVNGVWAGGSFTAGPVSISGNFAVLFKHDAAPGDTVRLFMNNAFAPTSTAAGIPLMQKYGEGLGLIRFNGFFQATTNSFSGASGNDYEFIVSPFVSFNMSAGVSVLTPTICNYASGSFSNVSTPMNAIENRQFNFNKFKAVWSTTLTGGTNPLMPAATDSIHNWTFSGSSAGPSTAKNPTAVFTSLGNQTGNLTLKYKRMSTPFATSLTDGTAGTLSVTNAFAPQVTISGVTSFCTNSPPVTTTLYCVGNPTYTWTAPINSNSSAVVVTQSATTVYTVLAVNGGCTAVNMVTVSVNPIPSVSLTAAKASVCTNATGGTTVALTGAPSGGVYSGTYVTPNKFSPANTGTFTPVYTYTDSATGCTNSVTSSVIVINCTGIEQPELNDRLLVFPNPSPNGILSIKNLEGENTIKLYNILGTLILEQVSSREEVVIDLSGQANGSYFLKIIDMNGHSKTLKIVNQN